MSIVQTSSELAPQTVWPIDRIKDHTEKIGSGVTPSGGATSYLDIGIPLLRSQNVHFDGLRLDDVAYISEETHDEMRGTKLRECDVLLNITGASIGRCSFVPDGFGEGNVNQHVCIIRPTAKLNYRFLTYCLSAPWGQDQIFSSFTGASRQGLGQRDLGEIRVPLPLLAEQQRIAAYLDASCAAIDGAIRAKRRQLEVLDDLRKSIIHKAVTRGLNDRDELKDSGVEWIEQCPSHWKVKRIKQVTEILRGKFTHRPRNDPSLYDGPYPFIQTGDVAAADKHIRDYKQTLNDEGFSISKQFPRGTLVMTIAANIGDVAILDFEACFPDSIVGFYPHHGIEVDFLYYLFSGLKEVFMSAAVLSTQLNLNIVRIETIRMPIPPVQEQNSIAAFLDEKCEEILRLQRNLKTQVAALEQYRKSLIHECVTGKRRIAEADLATG
jgi:type I restriction enzyme S subunit